MADSTAAAALPSLPPQAQLFELVIGYWRTRAITVAAELELADHLTDGPLHVDELARRTNTHAPSLFRLLRALESVDVFKQVSSRVFANTSMSQCLCRRVTGSLWAFVRSRLSVGGGGFEAWTGLLDSVQTGKPAFDQIYGYNQWEFLRRNSASADLFNEAMRSTTSVETPAVTAAYDWSRFPVIVDIGGGIGTQLVDILNAHPSCKGILFDQPEVIARAILHERMERVGGSFFERVPTAADAYILRFVIHDWGDEEAVAILRTVRASVKAGSRVILIEQIIPVTPEYAVSKWADLHMMLVVGGKERSVQEYRQLVEKAGLDLEQIISTPTRFSLIVSHPRI